MIKIGYGGRGLSFDDWCHALINALPGTEYGDYRRDLDNEAECYWMSYLSAWNGSVYWDDQFVLDTTEKWDNAWNKVDPNSYIGKQRNGVPDEIRRGRGVGAWWNPQTVIVTDRISSRLKQGSPLWDVIPEYRMIRPFNNTKGLKFFYSLFGKIPSWVNARNMYVTSMEKQWSDDPGVLLDEFTVLQPKRIICLQPHTFTHMQLLVARMRLTCTIWLVDMDHKFSNYAAGNMEALREKIKQCLRD